MTLEGTMLVDGILASCYATVNHDLGHIGVAPIRWFPHMIEWIFGDEDGFLIYANIGEYVAKWMQPFEGSNFVKP